MSLCACLSVYACLCEGKGCVISLTIEFETNSFLLIALSCEVCTWSDQASGFLFRELAVGWVTERLHVPPSPSL